MIKFKACPRCKLGDLYLNEDVYGKYRQCLQCGHIVYPQSKIAAPGSPGLPSEYIASKESLAA